MDKCNGEDSVMRDLQLCPTLSAMVVANPDWAFEISSPAIGKAGVANTNER